MRHPLARSLRIAAPSLALSVLLLLAACSGSSGRTSSDVDDEEEAGLDGGSSTRSDGGMASDAKATLDAATPTTQDAADAAKLRCNTLVQTAPTPTRATAPAPTHVGGTIVPGRYHLLRETSPNGSFDELRATTWLIAGNTIQSRGVRPSNPTGAGEITSYSFTVNDTAMLLTFTCLGDGNTGLGQTRSTLYTATATTLTLSYQPSGYTVELELQP